MKQQEWLRILHERNKGRIPWNKGKQTGLVPRTAFKKGQVPWNKGIKNTWYNPKGLELGRKYFIGKKFTEEHKENLRKPHPSNRGINNHNWKEGVTYANDKIRKSLKYKLWRKAVFERDNYTCRICGARNGYGKKITLHADHIKPFAYFPSLRLDINNGQTLCINCHKKTKTYGYSIKIEKNGVQD